MSMDCEVLHLTGLFFEYKKSVLSTFHQKWTNMRSWEKFKTTQHHINGIIWKSKQFQQDLNTIYCRKESM